MIHTHTMTQLKTVQEPMNFLSSNISNANVLSGTYLEVPKTTAPTGVNIIPASSLNYIKIVPMLATLATNQTIRITGWNEVRSGANIYYVPQMLFYGTLAALNATGVTINSVALYSVATITKTQGDAKIYNATSAQNTAFMLVDTLGCSLIEIEYFATAGGSATGGNVFYGAI